jgi:hypothetical protein
MGNSSVLARLPINGTVTDSRGTLDAFKIPLLNEAGKLNASLLIDEGIIYDIAGLSFGSINFDTPSVMPNAPEAGVKLFLDAQNVFKFVDPSGNIQPLVAGRTEAVDWNAPVGSSREILNKPLFGTAAFTDASQYAEAEHGHDASEITGLSDTIEAASGYATTIPDTTYSVQVGGAVPQAASVWKTKTLVQALDTILFPTVLAKISQNKSLSLLWHYTSELTSGPVEIGTTYNIAFNYIFNRGTIENGSGAAGPALVGTQSGNATIVGRGITSQSVAIGQVFSNIKLTEASNTWTVAVPHSEGSGEYYDNKGNVLNSLDIFRDAGTVSASITIAAFYPYYVLKSPVPFTAQQFKDVIATEEATSIAPGAQLIKNISSSAGTLSIPYNISGAYLAVAYPSASTEKTKYYVNALDNGSIGAIFNPVEELLTSGRTDTWSLQKYKYHISSTPLTNSAATIELRN